MKENPRLLGTRTIKLLNDEIKASRGQIVPGPAPNSQQKQIREVKDGAPQMGRFKRLSSVFTHTVIIISQRPFLLKYFPSSFPNMLFSAAGVRS